MHLSPSPLFPPLPLPPSVTPYVFRLAESHSHSMDCAPLADLSVLIAFHLCRRGRIISRRWNGWIPVHEWTHWWLRPSRPVATSTKTTAQGRPPSTLLWRWRQKRTRYWRQDVTLAPCLPINPFNSFSLWQRFQVYPLKFGLWSW